MFKFENFRNSMSQIGVDAEIQTFDLLNSHYSEPTRFYHDKSHVSECLSQFQKYRDRAARPEEIEIAIWFHDAIYDTKASDNEEKSAELAEHHLSSVNAKSDSITRIVKMILATKTHEVSDLDSKLMVDIDLGILGASQDIFEKYDRNIRKEYHWVPAEVYLPGRAQILTSFLDREILYHTPEIRELYEAQARKNLSGKIAELAP